MILVLCICFYWLRVWSGVYIFYGIGLCFFWVFFGRFCLGFGVYLCWLGGVYLLFYYYFFDAFFVAVFYFVFLHNNFCILYLYLVLTHLFEIHIFLLC